VQFEVRRWYGVELPQEISKLGNAAPAMRRQLAPEGHSPSVHFYGLRNAFERHDNRHVKPDQPARDANLLGGSGELS